MKSSNWNKHLQIVEEVSQDADLSFAAVFREGVVDRTTQMRCGLEKKTRKPLQKLGCSLIGNDDLLLMLKKVPKILNEKDNFSATKFVNLYMSMENHHYNPTVQNVWLDDNKPNLAIKISLSIVSVQSKPLSLFDSI